MEDNKMNNTVKTAMDYKLKTAFATHDAYVMVEQVRYLLDDILAEYFTQVGGFTEQEKNQYINNLPKIASELYIIDHLLNDIFNELDAFQK